MVRVYRNRRSRDRLVRESLAHREADEARRRIEAQLKFVERQIEELYGPLAAALYEGRRTFLDLLDSLGRSSVFVEDRTLPPEELSTWLFWAETEFLPRNEQIKLLLKTKVHLIDNPNFPESYVSFLDHCNSWAVNHRRWKEQQVEYSWRSKINWPRTFENEVITTFQNLKRRHTEIIGALTAELPARRLLADRARFKHTGKSSR